MGGVDVEDKAWIQSKISLANDANDLKTGICRAANIVESFYPAKVGVDVHCNVGLSGHVAREYGSSDANEGTTGMKDGIGAEVLEEGHGEDLITVAGRDSEGVLSDPGTTVPYDSDFGDGDDFVDEDGHVEGVG